MTDAPPVLNRGVGTATKCRSCKASIVFAVAYTTGKQMPMQLDDAGEWTLENGIAKHLGPVSPQLDVFAVKVQRYTSHFSVCPDADKFRSRR